MCQPGGWGGAGVQLIQAAWCPRPNSKLGTGPPWRDVTGSAAVAESPSLPATTRLKGSGSVALMGRSLWVGSPSVMRCQLYFTMSTRQTSSKPETRLAVPKLTTAPQPP